MTHRSSIALVSLLLGACSLAPVYERPAAPVAAAWPAGTSAAAAAVEPHWQAFFRDPQLRRAIALALANNRDLRVATLNIDKARALYRVQRADRLPTLDAFANGNRQRIPADLNQAGDGAVIGSQYSAGIGMTAFELDFFGRVRNLNEAALQQYVATEEARNSAQISLVAEVAGAWHALAADHALLALTRQTLQTREESYGRLRLSREQGASSELDLRQAQTLVESARATLARQTRQRMLDENALTLLLGQPLPADLQAPQQTEALAAVPAGLPSALLAARPDIRRQEALLIAANANIGAARAAFFPRIALTAGTGTASGALSGLFDAGSGIWNFAPQLTLPIFDAGRNNANLDVARRDRDIAVAEYEKSIQVAFREVADALAGHQTLGDELQAIRAQVDAETARFGLSELRYRSGYTSYLELLDAQRALFGVQEAAIQVALDESRNRIGLYKALGGGWRD